MATLIQTTTDVKHCKADLREQVTIIKAILENGISLENQKDLNLAIDKLESFFT